MSFPTWHEVGNPAQTCLGGVLAEGNENQPVFADTWFIARDRFPICVRPRKLRLHAADFSDAREVEKQCRLLWQDLDNGDHIEFQIVDQAPIRLPGIKFQLVLIQGEWVGSDWTLFHSVSLPPLQQLRAVMFPAGCIVQDLLRHVQLLANCNSYRWMCFIKFWKQGHEMYRNTWDLARILPSRFVEGDIRHVDLSDEEPSDDDSTQVPDRSEDERTDADSDAENDDDNVGLMSAQPIMHQFDHPDPYPWQADVFEEVEDAPLVQEDPNPPVQFAGDHMGRLMDEIRDLTGEDIGEGPPWIAATFGLGLLDLGRRDIHLDPRDMPVFLQDVERVWADHL